MPSRLLALQTWHRITGFSRFVLRRLIDDRCLQTAGSLTYTTLLAIVPLFTIALTLFAAFPMFGDYSGKFKSFILTNLVPDASGKIIGTYMHQFSDNAERLTAMGMVGLTATALLLMFTIEKTLNQIWGAPRSRNFLTRTLIYWAALTLGPLLIGLSISMASWLSSGLPGDLPGLGLSLLKLGPWLLVFLTLSMVFLAVPNCYVPRSHALLAAFCAASALDIMKLLFSLYIKKFATFKLVYGAFASFPIFLLWLYVSWVIVLGGAVLSACLSYWHNDAWNWKGKQGSRFEQAVLILLALNEAYHNGEILHINTLRRRVGLGLDVTNQLLEAMTHKKWVEASRDGKWLLAIDLEQIRLVDVFEHIQIPLSATKEQALGPYMLRMHEELGLTLAEYAIQRTI
ncbi:MAG: YihY family inner membrane protein [Formivibrio sp.]|nr:YihY family inner membrane protein [Formivibrio sp.]